jgi:ACDE family multidrug resistance protein
MNLSALRLGVVFFAWGILVALFAVFGAVRLKDRFGTARTLYGSLICVAVILAVIGVFSGTVWAVIAAVVASGAFVGLNNTLVTTAVMSISPVPRNVASATYGFVRFIGGGLAPFAAGLLAESVGVKVPFLIAAVVVLVGAALLSTVHTALEDADADEEQPGPSLERADAEEAVREIPAVEEEAILAEEALLEDRR